MKITAMVSEIELDVKEPADVEELRFLLAACDGLIPLKYALEDSDRVGILSGDMFSDESFRLIELSPSIRYVKMKKFPNPTRIVCSGNAHTIEADSQKGEYRITLDQNVIELVHHLYPKD